MRRACSIAQWLIEQRLRARPGRASVGEHRTRSRDRGRNGRHGRLRHQHGNAGRAATSSSIPARRSTTTASVGDGVHVGPGSHLCGHVTRRRAHADRRRHDGHPGVRIGSGAVIGAGSTVLDRRTRRRPRRRHSMPRCSADHDRRRDTRRARSLALDGGTPVRTDAAAAVAALRRRRDRGRARRARLRQGELLDRHRSARRSRAEFARLRRRAGTRSRSPTAASRSSSRCTRSASARATTSSCRRARSSRPRAASCCAARARCSPTSTRSRAT